MNKLVQELEMKTNLIENTKGSLYYNSSLDYNLDLFCKLSRYNPTDELIRTFKNAIEENKELALANLLYLLDIREGKGERLIFKTLFKYLCEYEKDLSLAILPFIGELGRWDYCLVGLDTLIDNEVVALIKKQLDEDLSSENPSLLAKWLPSIRTHGKNNKQAKMLVKKLGISEKEYRNILKTLRSRINIVESNLTNKKYEKIDFEKVPTKAMLKYKDFFKNNLNERYKEYLNDVAEGDKKINTKGLYCYEIVRQILLKQESLTDEESLLFDDMWNNQRDFLNGYDKNLLVMADTSGSMTFPNCLPIANSIGLALYIAERNKGAFKDYFLTFSMKPKLVKVTGKTIADKIDNVEPIVDDTNIDECFKLLLDTYKEKNITEKDMVEEIIIISDMEFDSGCHTENGTNFEGWKKNFEEAGYKLPKIIFWNVAAFIQGVPVTKYDKDVAIVSGFNTSILENITNIENIDPIKIMICTLEKYVKLLSTNEEREVKVL